MTTAEGIQKSKSFFSPKNNQDVLSWATAIIRDKFKVTMSTKVCSNHFVQAGNIARKRSLTQAREFMDRFYHNSQTETYTFHVSTLLNSISDKITAKNVIVFSKSKFLTKKQLLHVIIPSCDLHCLPPGDPRIFSANTGIQSLVTHSFSDLSMQHFS